MAALSLVDVKTRLDSLLADDAERHGCHKIVVANHHFAYVWTNGTNSVTLSWRCANNSEIELTARSSAEGPIPQRVFTGTYDVPAGLPSGVKAMQRWRHCLNLQLDPEAPSPARTACLCTMDRDDEADVVVV